MKDYYQILEVTRTATENEIKKAYRKLAKKYHPDTNGGDEKAAQKFQEITEAYAVLSDEKKRREYDEGGINQTRKTGDNAKAAKTNKAGFQSQNFRFDFGDMMFDELQKKEKKSGNGGTAGQVDFADMSTQFANFFGFKPK